MHKNQVIHRPFPKQYTAATPPNPETATSSGQSKTSSQEAQPVPSNTKKRTRQQRETPPVLISQPTPCLQKQPRLSSLPQSRSPGSQTQSRSPVSQTQSRSPVSQPQSCSPVSQQIHEDPDTDGDESDTDGEEDVEDEDEAEHDDDAEDDDELHFHDAPAYEGPPVLTEEEERITLENILDIPGRENYLTVLDPNVLFPLQKETKEKIPHEKNRTWFRKDKGVLTRRISRILKNQFDGLYTSWSKVPQDRQRRYFVKFAQTHHWDLGLTDQIRLEFEIVCKRRMKEMVSTVRRSRIQPRWIDNTRWKELCTLWGTKKAKKRSKTASKARKSDRNGLGPHQHLTGQKSYIQIQDEMEEELERPVIFGEVFLKTHTKPDGTFVDEKAKKVDATYQDNLKARLAEPDMEGCETEDGSPILSVEEQNAIFLQSTERDARGNPFGLGSLKDNLGRQVTGGAAVFVAIQQQLEAAQQEIEKQAAESALRETETKRILAEQESKNEMLVLLSKFIQKKNSDEFKAFVAAQAQSSPTNSP